MTAEEPLASVTAQLKEAVEQLQAVTEDLRQTQEQLKQTQKQLHEAQRRIAALEKLKTPPASFVKANQKKPPAEEKKSRKKREVQYKRARRRGTPTHIVEHRIVQCPQCHKWHEAPVELSEQVLGQGRIGVRLASLIAYLRSVMRLPIRQLRAVMRQVYGLEVSIGEIVELLHRIREHAQPVLDGLKGEIRSSPAVQADETGWREDGINGYIWSVSTPQIRYYEYHHSRSGEVVKQLIGQEFAGVLGSDFYAGYNIHQGLHQRCWVHYLRDVHDLKKAYPDDEELSRWAKAVKDVYEEAVVWATQGPDPGLSPRQHHQARAAQQHAFEERLWALCHPYVQTAAPQQTLCKRVEQFLPELFVFVAVPGVPAHNNLAERSVRPLVSARKISGGTRSPRGSETRMELASLFGTWMAQGLNPFHQCLALLTTKSSLG